MVVHRNVLDLIGNTPLVELTRFDTGPCRLFAQAREPESRRLDQGPHRRLRMIEAAEREGS